MYYILTPLPLFPSSLRWLRYHPEYNAIERLWSHSKQIVRRACDYSVLNLLNMPSITLSIVSMPLIRRPRMSWLCIDSYATGLEGYLHTEASRSGRADARRPPERMLSCWRRATRRPPRSGRRQKRKRLQQRLKHALRLGSMTTIR